MKDLIHICRKGTHLFLTIHQRVIKLRDYPGRSSWTIMVSALFSVWGDGRELLSPTEVRGGAKPKHIKLNVTGVKVLKVFVDYGKNQDIGDHADWMNARLIRK